MRTRLVPPPSRPTCGRAIGPAVGLALVGSLLTGCSGGSAPSARSTASAPSTASASSPASTTPVSSPGTPSGMPVLPAGLVALWPVTTVEQVRSWQAAYRSDGSRAWALDVDRTALAFVRDHLRYTDIDRVVSRTIAGADARIGVGWAGETGRPHAAGVLHLVRFGTAADAPWVVVGSEDTTLTLTAPRYGASVRSPVAVGGRITGVDESLRVTVVGPASSTPLGDVAGLPAGGQGSAWTTVVRFAAPAGTPLTIAVSTGGHLKTVERFAITAVRAT